MEPITILTYIGIVFILIIGVELSIILFHVLRIVKKVDKITNFANGISEILDTIEKVPLSFLNKILNRFF